MDKELIHLIEHYLSLNLSKNLDYDKFNEYAIVHHSSTIEGSTLTEIETHLLLDEGLTPKGKPLEHSLMVKDHFQALKYIMKDADQQQRISISFIQSINAHVMKYTGKQYETIFGKVDGSSGSFRKGNVSAGNTYFVNYDKVENLCAKLVQKVNEGLKKPNTVINNVLLSFDAHFDLLTIHPFYDGNGRTSRLLMNFIQHAFSLPLCIVFKEDKADYYKALEDTRKEENLNIFRNFMTGQYKKYLKTEIEKYKHLDKSSDNNSGYSLVF